jgi:2,3-dihydroxybiphenyl 1,2-dioxygenase
MGAIKSLGYVGVEASDLEAWRKFGSEILGVQVEDHDNGTLRFRMDERALRYVIYQGPLDDLAFAGWEVEDEKTLEAEAERLKALGLEISWGSPEAAHLRRVRRFFRFHDLEGMPHEMFFGAEIASTPFKSPKLISHFITGDQGIGHIVRFVKDLKKTESFFRDVLGFKLSDYIYEQRGEFLLKLAFLHVNPRHHSLAIGEVPMAKKRIDHLMMQVAALDDVGMGYDRVRETKTRVVGTLGKHPNDKMFSFYVGTPSGFSMEFGWGAISIEDDDKWQPTTYPITSEWGHRSPKRSEIKQGWEREEKLKAVRAAMAQREKEKQDS